MVVCIKSNMGTALQNCESFCTCFVPFFVLILRELTNRRTLRAETPDEPQVTARGRLKTFLPCLVFLCLLIITPVCAGELAIEDAFSPQQGATALIVRSIDEARQSIHVAAYSFTSRRIGWALIHAAQRGVDVRIVLDKSQRRSRYSMARSFNREGVPLHINDHYAIMHNKFMIIDGRILELGSFNYTRSAESRNAENVMVIRGAPQTIADYDRQWRRLWDESR